MTKRRGLILQRIQLEPTRFNRLNNYLPPPPLSKLGLSKDRSANSCISLSLVSTLQHSWTTWGTPTFVVFFASECFSSGSIDGFCSSEAVLKWVKIVFRKLGKIGSFVVLGFFFFSKKWGCLFDGFWQCLGCFWLGIACNFGKLGFSFSFFGLLLLFDKWRFFIF